ncbi:hypothetical protein KIPB_010832 [Kipferlia bialata]|uniref:Reverse transcriptase domain-containing protein n=1 Tax=Kipferlia bialata TaxID=797122 RepID=A0A391NQ35_9EUKA|nr:hypothetical protein KIPB_010832 [Kipferlia bialata]|eukprot:g10832.t1
MSAHHQHWRAAPRLIQLALRDGFAPILFRPPRQPHVLTSDPHALELLREEIQKGNFVPGQALAHHKMFPIPKSSGGHRLIHDLRSLNKAVRVPKFTMQPWRDVRDVVQGPGFWAIKIDLTAAYRQVALSADSAKWMGVLTPGGESWVPVSLCFGLSPSPAFFQIVAKTFAKVVVEALAAEEQLASQIVYLDDFLFLSRSRAALRRLVAIIKDKAELMGVLINWTKSVLEPTQRVEFLGLMLDLAANKITLTPEKAVEWVKQLKADVRRKWRKAVEKLAGRIAFLSASGAPILPHARELYYIKKNKSPTPPPALWPVVEWWVAKLKGGIHSPIYTQEAVCIASDATRSKAGALLYVGDELVAEQTWSFDPPLPIAVAELKALLLAMREWKEQVRSHLVCWATDSVSAKRARHTGGSPSSVMKELAPCAIELADLTQELDCIVKATWVSSKGNAAADWLSRQVGWSTAPLLAQMVRDAGPWAKDLFPEQVDCTSLWETQDLLGLRWFAAPPLRLLSKLLGKLEAVRCQELSEPPQFANGVLVVCPYGWHHRLKALAHKTWRFKGLPPKDTEVSRWFQRTELKRAQFRWFLGFIGTRS